MPLMTATLTGLDFKISPPEGREQALSSKEPTTWTFQVEALKAGLNPLKFELNGTLKVEGQEVQRTFFSYEETVDVAVNWLGLLEEYWQWIATTLLLPAAAGLWAFFRKRRSASPSAAA